MLGSITAQQKWTWTLWGKHPVAKDFFIIGPNTPLVKALSEWADGGYRQLIPDRGNGAGYHSWRFWVKGGEKNAIALGIGKDSCDTLGRPYPLLIVGGGLLDKWHRHWDLLPLALDDAWRQLEGIGARRNPDLSSLQRQLAQVAAPRPDWGVFRGMEGPGSRVPPQDQDPWPRVENGLADAPGVIATAGARIVSRIDGINAGDPLLRASRFLQWTREQRPAAPNAVFMGGAPDATYVVIFNRPLRQADFARLWSMGEVVGDAALEETQNDLDLNPHTDDRPPEGMDRSK